MIGIERRGTELPSLGQRVEHEVELGLALRVEEPRFGLSDDALQRLEARVGRLHAASHVLDRQEPAADLDVRLAQSGRPRSADVVVAVLAGADDRRIADAPGNFPGEAGRRRDGGEIALRSHGIAVDRSRLRHDQVIRVGHVEVVVRRAQIGPPPQPRLAGMLGQQVFFLEAEGERKALGTLTDEEDVRRILEDQLRDFRRRLDVFERANRARPLGGPVHAGGVELYHALRVRQAAIADGVVVGIELLDLHAFDHRVERVGALHQHVERFLHGAQTVRARDRDGLRRPARLRREGARRPHRMRNSHHRTRRNAARGGPQELATRHRLGHARF